MITQLKPNNLFFSKKPKDVCHKGCLIEDATILCNAGKDEYHYSKC